MNPYRHRIRALAACLLLPADSATAADDEPPVAIYGIVDVAISLQDSNAPGARRCSRRACGRRAGSASKATSRSAAD